MNNWLSILLTVGISSPVVVLVTALLARRKTIAEAGEIANRAAGEAIKNLRAELNSEYERRADAIRATDIEYGRRLEAVRRIEERDRQIHHMTLMIDAHTRWDKLVVGILRENGIDGIPEPPSLANY